MHFSPSVLAVMVYIVNIHYFLLISGAYIVSVLMMKDIDNTKNFGGKIWLIFLIQHISYCFILYAIMQKSALLIILLGSIVYTTTLGIIIYILKIKLRFTNVSLLISGFLFTLTYFSPYITLYVIYLVKS